MLNAAIRPRLQTHSDCSVDGPNANSNRDLSNSRPVGDFCGGDRTNLELRNVTTVHRCTELDFS